MTQDLIAYTIVLLSACYLVRQFLRRKSGKCCGSRACPKVPQPLLHVEPPVEH